MRRWELARRLRELRVNAGISVEQAAAELMCSAAKVSRMETAGRGVLPRDVRDLCRLYGTSDAERDELMQLANDARQRGWWQTFGTLDEMVATYVGLESAAVRVRSFQGLRMQGLLQSPEYTRALLTNLTPPSPAPVAWMDEQVELRRRRQERVASGELRLDVIVDEAVMRRSIGGPEVMGAQVAKLLAESSRPNVTIQLIPFGHGSHPGLDGSFELLSFPQDQIGEVVFVEGLLGRFLLDKQADVDRYNQVFTDLADRFALSPEETVAWLEAFEQEIRSSSGADEVPRAAKASRQHRRGGST